jgi:D-aminoacyl-tRNA deacylase
MRIVLQRVKSASVAVNGKIVSSVKSGFLILVGVSRGDTAEQAEYLAGKVSKFRIMDDPDGKMNLSLLTAGGEILSISQFTLADPVLKGNRPGFSSAAFPDDAEKIWKGFNSSLRKFGIEVKEGIFGCHMEVALVNDGPVCFVLDSDSGGAVT